MTTADFLFCSGCQQEKPKEEFHHRRIPIKIGDRGEYAYECKECRRLGRDRTEQLLEAKFRRYGTVCGDCGFPCKVDHDGLCPTCELKRGFKFCVRCKQKKLPYLDFYSGHHRWCIECSTPQKRYQYNQCPDCKVWHKRGHKCTVCKSTKKNRRCVCCLKVKPIKDFFTSRTCLECKDQPEDKKHLSAALRKYGINIDEYQTLLRTQGGVCCICGKQDGRRLGVDHNNKTSKIRGLLCINCNLGLGNFQDQPELLLKAAAYLRQRDIPT